MTASQIAVAISGGVTVVFMVISIIFFTKINARGYNFRTVGFLVSIILTFIGAMSTIFVPYFFL